MTRLDLQAPFSAEEASLLVELAEKAITAQDLTELVDPFLQGLATTLEAPAAFLYLGDARLPMNTFFDAGLSLDLAGLIKKLCHEKFPQLSRRFDLPPETIFLSSTQTAWVNFFPLQRKMKSLGLLGLVTDKELAAEPVLLKKGLALLTSAKKDVACDFTDHVGALVVGPEARRAIAARGRLTESFPSGRGRALGGAPPASETSRATSPS